MQATYYATVQDNGSLVTRCPVLKGKQVVITERKSKRSNEQNRWLWGCAIPLIAEHCGYDAHEREALHYELLAVRFGTVESKLRPGVQMPAKTSSQMNTRDFSAYMEWLARYAATELGVIIPLPDERWLIGETA